MHKTLLLLRNIPSGRVVTYKELARASNTSPRAVGSILSRNSDPVYYPCYKVVGSDGRLTGYSALGGLAKKKQLLEGEGILVEGDKVNQAFFYAFP